MFTDFYFLDIKRMQTVYQTVVFNWRNAENISGQYPIHLPGKKSPGTSKRSHCEPEG